MTRSQAALCAMIAAAGANACANPSPPDVDASLKAATVAALPGADVAKIAISASERHATKWTWTAAYDGTVYSCDADEQMRLPACAPKGPTAEVG